MAVLIIYRIIKNRLILSVLSYQKQNRLSIRHSPVGEGGGGFIQYI